ncbi:MAG: SulP family inorganic anion transporter [Chloroflexota bacterium]|nr:SulP family inorganic anion transporter [Chloroflexota bacterium]
MNLSFSRKNLTSDLGAAVTMAIVAIPDAIASAILAGVNPTYGFNALMVGTPVGSLFTSSQFMNIGLTAAMMMAVADAFVGMDSSTIVTALVTLTVLIGVFQLILGLFKLGVFTRFISNAVMIGFLTGVATVLILGQLGDLTGYQSEYSNKVMQALDLFLHPLKIDPATTLTGLGTIALILLLGRTRLKNYSLAVGVLVSSVAVALLSLDTVALVGDTNEIIGSFPLPALPDLSLVRSLLLPAVSIGMLGLIQAAGISQTIPNPDGEYPDPSGDFTGQGVANIASGFFRGLPLGGSLGGTGIVISAGAKSRWANVFMGLLVGVFVLLFANQVERVAIPAVAAVLIVAGFGTFNFEAIKDVRDVSRSSLVVMGVTFLATLTMPIQEAIIAGILLSIFDYVYTSSKDIQLIELVLTEDGGFETRLAPAQLGDNSITVLYGLGDFFFAGARTLEGMLPRTQEAHRAVVILRLHARSQIRSTFILVLERYAQRLQANGGKLILSGVSERVKEQLDRTETTETIPEDDIFMASSKLGVSTKAAIQATEAWLAEGTENFNLGEGE